MQNIPPYLQAKLDKIKLIAFDVDGILTDGGLTLGDNGEEFKTFHVRDGQGLVMLLKSGYELAIITGRQSQIVVQRMQELGIKHVYQGCSDKLSVFESILKDTGLDADQAAYMGDDLPDLPVIKRAGLGITVPGGNAFVQQHADLITKQEGGQGAAREISDLILTAHGKLDRIHEQYLNG